jgi:hypothetical protein
MKIKHEGCISLNIIDEFETGFPFKSFFAYVSSNLTIEGFFAVAGMLCPDFIELEGHILLAENINALEDNLSSPFGNDKKTIERYINLFSTQEFTFRPVIMPQGSNSESFVVEIPNEQYQLKLVQILNFFWQRRLKELFPNKEFDFEITKEGLFDEDGICLTFSEKID